MYLIRALSIYLVHSIPFFLTFPSKRILILGSVISLPLIYGTNDFDTQLDKYLFEAVYPTDEKELNNFKNLRGRFLRQIALMQLYACGAPRKANDELESSDSVLDCSEYFKDPKNLKSEFQAIWKHGGERSQVDRQGKGLTESSVGTLLVKLTKQSTPEDQLVVQKLLTSEVRPHFSRFVKEIREEKEEA